MGELGGEWYDAVRDAWNEQRATLRRTGAFVKSVWDIVVVVVVVVS